MIVTIIAVHAGGVVAVATVTDDAGDSIAPVPGVRSAAASDAVVVLLVAAITHSATFSPITLVVSAVMTDVSVVVDDEVVTAAAPVVLAVVAGVAGRVRSGDRCVVL